MSWPDFYKGRLLSESYLRYFEARYSSFIAFLRTSIKAGDRVVEIGCGLGTTTKILQTGTHPFCGFHCYDVAPEMVHMAKQNLWPFKAVDVADATKPTGCRPDIVHSHGLLEHFDDVAINGILDAQAQDGPRWSIHYVPGIGHGRPSFGDERLLPLDYWLDVHRPHSHQTFNDGKDYILAWRF